MSQSHLPRPGRQAWQRCMPLAVLVALAAALAGIALQPAARPALAAGTGVMTLSPSNPFVPLGSPFTIDVVGQASSSLGSFEFELDYDPAVISYTQVLPGPFLSSTGRSVFCPAPIIDSINGKARFGCTSTGVVAGPIGTGTLATVTFGTVAAGSSPLAFTRADMSDELGDSFASVTGVDGSVLVFTGTPPATYTPTNTPTITPTPSPTPTGAVPPVCGPLVEATVCFDPVVSQAQAGSPVSVNIRAEDVTNLGAFDFTVAFGSSLGIPSVISGPFLGSTGRAVQCLAPVTTATSIRYNCITLGPDASVPGGINGPDGGGVIAVLTFTPLAEGVAPISFTTVQLLHPDASVIATAPPQTGAIDVAPGPTATPCPGVCPTDTPTETPSPSATPTLTPTPTASRTPTATNTPCGASCPTPTFTATPTNTPAPGTVYVSPSSSNVLTDQSLTVDIVADSVTNLGSFSFSMRFQSAIAGAGHPSPGPFLGSTGRAVTCYESGTEPSTPTPTPTATAYNGLVHFTCITTGPQALPGPTGSGVIARVPLTALAAGYTDLRLEDVTITNPPGAVMPLAGVVYGALTVTQGPTATPCGGPCPTATFTPTSSPTPTAAPFASGRINPAAQAVAVGDIVEVQVDVAGVADLGSFEFSFWFADPLQGAQIPLISCLDPLANCGLPGIENGAFPGSTGRSLFCPAAMLTDRTIRYGCATIGSQPGPSGAGTLAVLRFRALLIGPADLFNLSISLSQPDGDDIPIAIVDAGPAFPEISIYPVGSVPTPTSSPTQTPTATPTVTATPTLTPSASPTPTLAADADGDGFADALPSAHAAVNIDVTRDNCPGLYNPAQLNTDGEPRPNGPVIVGDDVTWPRSDALGDACDPDDDNDGIADADETSGIACAPIAATDPALADTDGDHLTDAWECANASDPLDAGSHALGPPSTVDLDADQVFDTVEARGYNSSPTSADSDADGCSDLIETGSINGDRALNTTDLLALRRRAAWPTVTLVPPEAVQDGVLDLNKDGFVNSGDVLMLSRWIFLVAPPPCV